MITAISIIHIIFFQTNFLSYFLPYFLLFFENSNLGESKLQLIPSFQTVEIEDPKFRLMVINPTELSIRIPAGTQFVEFFEIAEVARINDEKNMIYAIRNSLYAI